MTTRPILAAEHNCWRVIRFIHIVFVKALVARLKQHTQNKILPFAICAGKPLLEIFFGSTWVSFRPSVGMVNSVKSRPLKTRLCRQLSKLLIHDMRFNFTHRNKMVAKGKSADSCIWTWRRYALIFATAGKNICKYLGYEFWYAKSVWMIEIFRYLANADANMERRYEPILTIIKPMRLKCFSLLGTSGMSGEIYPAAKYGAVRNSFTPVTRDLDVLIPSGEELTCVTADRAFKSKRCTVEGAQSEEMKF